MISILTFKPVLIGVQYGLFVAHFRFSLLTSCKNSKNKIAKGRGVLTNAKRVCSKPT